MRADILSVEHDFLQSIITLLKLFVKQDCSKYFMLSVAVLPISNG